MSQADPERWFRVKAILDEALELRPDERTAFLDQACAGDEPLRGELESLVLAADGDWGFFDADAAARRIPMFDDVVPPSRVGERIGAYEVLAELGRGGMGVVLLARRADDEFQKKVAIKLVRPGLASDVALQRFRSERQISATLDHPSIARLLDGGTTERGEPYFAMEYVEGETLLAYCQHHSLSLEERLRLFREVCAAVQYAHQSLVVHRDIKPGNILVTAEGTPKLLDFGIAKLLQAETGAQAPEQTATLLRVLTPEYASPEQVRGRPVTTASDVYSLGIVLYELLTGEKPYRVETTDPEELVRVVCERDPERPSTRTAGLSGDLDAIVMKAIRKEPELRYASADALSNDVGRYLEGRPVLARKGSASYRAGKFIRRHRLAVAAAALVALALAGGVFATLRESRRAREAEARAQRRFDDVRALANSFLFEFHDAIRDLPGSTAARSLVVKRALEYLDKLSRESAGDRALNRELAAAYQKVGDVQGNPFSANLGDMAGALESYRKAIALLEPVVAAGGSSDEERSTLASGYLVSGGITLNAGDPAKAVTLARQGLALREGLAGVKPADRARQIDLAQAWQWLAFNLAAAGQDKEAAESLERQGAILLALQRSDPTDRAVRLSLSQNLYLRGLAFQKAREQGAALAAFQNSGGMLETLRREDPESVAYRRAQAYVIVDTGNTLLAMGDVARALEEYKRGLSVFEGLAAADPKSTDPLVGIAMSHHNLGEALQKLHQPGEAVRELRLAAQRYEAIRAATPTSSWVSGLLAQSLTTLADLETESGSRETACSDYRRALRLFEEIQAGGRLPSERQAAFDRAKTAEASCVASGLR